MLAIYVSLVVLAQVSAFKIVKLWMFTVPVAVFAYSLTFLVTDILYDYVAFTKNTREAHELSKMFVISGFAANLVIVIYASLTTQVRSCVVPEMCAIYDKVFNFSINVVVASLIAYLVAQFTDITIFHKLFIKHRGRKGYVRNNLSTMTAQLLDTCIFITLAFHTLPLVMFGEPVVPLTTIPHMILSQYVIKVIIALCDTLPYYTAVKALLKYEKMKLTTQSGS